MINRSRSLILIVCVCLAGVVFGLRCALSELAGGNTSQTGNPYVVGKLYNPDGSGAKNARVQFVPINYDPKTGPSPAQSVDSTITDAAGGYHLDSLPAGAYNIFGRSVTGNSFRSSFTIPGNIPVTIPNDTLKAPGSLRGVVRLQPGDDSRTVFIILLGTTTFLLPGDVIGNFIFSGLAEGSYQVRLLAGQSYEPLDTVFTIKSGVNTALKDTLRLKYNGIPAPLAFKTSYDTLLQVVTLSWSKPTSGRSVEGYNIYRKHQDSSFALLEGNCQDTIFRDSTGLQGISYQYQVAAVDSVGTEGTKTAAASVTITGVLVLQATLLKGPGSGVGYFTAMKSFSRDASGNFYCIDADANFARVQKFDSAGNFVLQWGSFGSGDGQFKNPRDITCDTAGNVYVADNTLSRVQGFSDQGLFLSKWGSYGTAPGQFSGLVEITAHGGFIYTGEDDGMRLQKFDRSGAYLSSINTRGGVSGLSVDDSLTFATVNGQLLLKYSSAGNLLDTVYKAGRMRNSSSECAIARIFRSTGSDALGVINRSENSLLVMNLNGKRFYTCQVAGIQTTVMKVSAGNGMFYVGTYDGHILAYANY